MTNGIYTIVLLIMSNVFMTFAWYGHLRLQQSGISSNWPLYLVIAFSWMIAFFEHNLLIIWVQRYTKFSKLPNKILKSCSQNSQIYQKQGNQSSFFHFHIQILESIAEGVEQRLAIVCLCSNNKVIWRFSFHCDNIASIILCI